MTVFTTAPWLTYLIVPKNGVINVAITDNVLDWEHWPVRQLSLENGIVTEVSDIQKGAYSFDKGNNPSVGWTQDQLKKWLAWEYDGFPTTYHVKVEVH